MKRTMLAVAAALVTCMWAAGAGAQEAAKVPASLEGYVPSDAILYAHYQGLPGASKTFQQTELKKLLDEPEVAEFGKELSRFMDALIRQKAAESPFQWADAQLLMDSEIAFALLDVRGRIPSVALVVRAGKRADELAKVVDRLMAEAAKHDEVAEDEIEGLRFKSFGPICIAWSGKDLLITSGRETLRRVVGVAGGKENNISRNDRYVAASKRFMGGGEFLMAHFDVERLRAVATEMRRPERYEKMWAATGLKDVNYIRLAVAPEAPGVKMSLYLHAPQGVKGFLKLIPDQPLDEKAALASASEEINSVMAARVNAGGIYDAIVEAMSAIMNPDRVQDDVDDMNREFGFDLRKDLLSALGEEVTVTVSRDVTALTGAMKNGGQPDIEAIQRGLSSIIATVAVKDPAKASECLTKLMDLIKKEAAQGTGMNIQVDTEEIRGTSVTILKPVGVPFAPSYTFAKGKCFVALTPDALIKAVEADGKAANKPLLDSAAWRTLRPHVATKPSVLGYTDTKYGFEDSWAKLPKDIETLMGMLGDKVPPNELARKIPSAAAIQPHFTGSMYAVSRDGEGILIEDYGDNFGTGSIAGVGIAAGMMLPALAKAQESARRAACMNNVRQIGLAMIQYAGDNDDKFPTSFGELLNKGYMTTFRVFLCPASKAAYREPGIQNFKAAAVADLDKEIDKLNTYVMVKGISHNEDADTIILYDKDGAHGGEGRNCFYNDGHVRWLPEAEFQRVIKAQEKRLAENK